MRLLRLASEVPEKDREILIMASNRHYFRANHNNFVGYGTGHPLPDPECFWLYLDDIQNIKCEYERLSKENEQLKQRVSELENEK